MNERIQKVLANAGYGSRRQVEAWIKEGRINVNGQPAELGQRIDVGDKIRINGQLIKVFKQIPSVHRIIMYHKPVGELTTRSDPEGRATIFQNLPKLDKGRWIAVGRLDINSSGLLLLTTDGELANKMMHPSQEIEREYAVRVMGEADQSIQDNLRKGVELEDGLAQFKRIRAGSGSGFNHWYHVVLQEGRNREVRRMWESQGLQVNRLIRVRFGPIDLPKDLAAGRCRELSPAQITQLLDVAGVRELQTHFPQVPPKQRKIDRGKYKGRGNNSTHRRR